MMKTPIAVSLFVIAANMSAQEGTVLETIPSPAPECKKNEISINTAPLFKILMNTGNAEATRHSITYKRNLDCKSALRFSLMADRINNDEYYLHTNRAVIKDADSLLIKESQYIPAYWHPHVNLGYERSFGKRSLKWFYGADLWFGYSESTLVLENLTLRRDTAHGSNVWVQTADYPTVVSKTRMETYSIGLSPFFGVKYPISKRFLVSAQMGFDACFRNQNTHTPNSGRSRAYTLDFNQATGILNDISLVYRF